MPENQCKAPWFHMLCWNHCNYQESLESDGNKLRVPQTIPFIILPHLSCLTSYELACLILYSKR